MRHKILWAVVLVLSVAGWAAAQETTTGTIAGEVKDAQGGAVPGASVTVTSSQGSKIFTTDQNGRFFAPYLTPGLYTVRVDLSGFSSVEQKNVNVRLGSRIELNFGLKVSDVQEVVEVVGAAPVVDMSRTTVGGNLDTATLQHLPVGRTVTETLYLVPGVTPNANMASAQNAPSIEGASGLENNYVVDGVNITNVGYGAIGSYNGTLGSLGSGVTTDFVKETQVKTAGFEAEYGQATGGVINVITQSGSNNFHGAVFGYFRPASMEASWTQLQTPNGTVNTTGRDSYDFGVNLGLPVIKNKLFFFGVYNPSYQTRTFIAPEGFPLRALGPVDQNRHVNAYAGKLTFQASTNHRFDLSFFGDPSTGESGPQRFDSLIGNGQGQVPDTAAYSSLEYGGHNQSLKYDGIISPKWLIEASIGHATNNFVETPSTNLPQTRDFRVVPTLVYGGVGVFDRGAEGTNLQFTVKSTHLFNAGGNHQVRYGLQYEDIEFTRDQNRTGPTFTLPNGVQTTTGGRVNLRADPTYGVIYRVDRANYIPAGVTKQGYTSLFLQDTWQIGKRLTLIPGVRWDRQHLTGQEPPPDVCFTDDSLPGAGDGTGAGVPCSMTWDNNWALRLGMTFDVLGNGKSKLFANYGRFYVKIPNDLAARALSADAGITRADYFDQALTRPVPDGTTALGTTEHFILAGTHASVFRQPYDSTYSEEFLGGVEFELGRSNNIGVRYIHRNIPIIMEDWQPAAIAAFDLGCPGADTVEYFISNISPSLPRFVCTGVDGASTVSEAAFEDPVHKYDAVEVTFNRAFTGGWGVFFSYRWSQLTGNYEGFFRSDNGQSDPSITSLFDFPTNDPSYTLIGRPQFGYQGDIRFQGATQGAGVLPNDRPNQIKLYPTYSFKNRLNLALGVNWGSGVSLTGLAANPNYTNNGEIPLTLRGGGIETVDGFKVRASSVTIVDFHADYAFKIKQQRLVLAADIFNLFNTQETVNYDNYSEVSFGAPNPNFGQPTNGGFSRAAGYTPPLQTRIGVRFEW